MTIADAFMVVAGALLAVAGLWWLGGGRWKWMPKPPGAGASMPTRMVVGLVHLLLGYHMLVWTLPAKDGPLQLPREQWLWVVLGCAGAIAGSVGMDRLEGKAEREG